MDDKKKVPFYKKPTLYIVLTVIFSLLIVADIVLAIFGPRGNTVGDFTNTMGMDVSTMTDIMGDADSDTDMSGFSGGGMGQGGMDFSGDMDFDPDSSDMPSFDMDSDSMDMSGFPSMGDFDTDADSDIDISNFTDANSTGNTSFLQTLRSHWLVILIVLAILDIASIVMLVITSKWERKREEAELRAQMNADGEVHLIRPVTKKKRKGSGLAWLIPVVGMVLLAVLVKSMADSTTETSSETEETVYTMTVETGTIDTVLPGTGTLAEEDSSDIMLPEGVEISAWYFADGDTVEEGDVLAKLDTSSIMSVIATVQGSLDELDEDLAEHEDDAVDEEMLATTSGRVIKIYAEEDASVIDIMYENGALMLISLDGLMAVSIETDEDLSVGDALDVTLADETVVTGKVESYINGTAIITIDDENLGVGDEVSIATEDGDELGTGALYIHSELKVTGYTGTVSEISVAEGDEVEAEDTLLVLTDVDYTAEYEMLLAERDELTETMQELFSLYADPYLYATCSGVISGLDDTTVTASTSSDAVYLGMNTVTVTYIISTSSNDVDEEESGSTEEQSETGTIGSSSNDMKAMEGSETSGAVKSDFSDSSDFGMDGSDDTSAFMSGGFSTDAGADMDGSSLASDNMDGFDMSADDTSAEDSVMEALQEEISSTYGVGETTLLSITPQDNFTISITVDELDILSVEVGQEVLVTLDAFPGQSFTGEVTDIDLTGTNSGGNSKYTVEVTIDRGEDMLVGMNASVKITLDTSDEVLVIPEDALVEDGSTVYVYTTYDEETGELGGLTEVTTGVSDGENVEILSGLFEGSTYYYSILDVVNYSSATVSSSSSSYSFSFDSLLGGSSSSGGGRGEMGR